MRIGVFVLAAGKGAGGPETYEVELVRGLLRVDRENSYHVYCTSEAAVRALGIDAPNLTCHVLRPRSRWIAVPLSLPLALLKDRIDLYHATYTPPPFSPKPFVFTHHDNSPFDNPEFFDPIVIRRLRPLIRIGLARGRHIVCPSEFTREQTASKFGIPRDRITAIPHGVSEAFQPQPTEAILPRLTERYGIVPPYFFYAGKLQGSKNIPRLLEAYARMLARLPDGPTLVLAGKRAVGDIDLDRILSRLGLAGRIKELGHVPGEDLPALYGAARALVFPSLSEGFGLPVIEAMACGTAVLTSNICSLPEVAGDGALLIDPCSVDAIAEGLVRLATDDPFVAHLRSQGLRRSTRFSWTANARQTLEVYRQAHRHARPPLAPGRLQGNQPPR